MTTITPTWFITGASSGFGMAFARYALDRGYNVVATARSVRKLDALAAQAPDRILVHKLDVTVPGDAEQAVTAAVRRFGRIDVVINNAGYGIIGAVEETPDAEFRAQMETNFFGALAVIRAALPQLRRQGSGAIVNISSLGGQLSFGGFGAYSASKFALEGMSESLAHEVAPFGIRVLIVEPGAFRTSFAADALKHMPVMDAYQTIIGGHARFRPRHGRHPGWRPIQSRARHRAGARRRNHAAPSSARRRCRQLGARSRRAIAERPGGLGEGRARHTNRDSRGRRAYAG